MTDWELLDQYRSGSQEAFTRLVGRHANWIYSVARRRVRDSHLAEDVMQAVFIILAQKAWTFRGGASLQSWLLKVTHYTSNHALRSERRRKKYEMESGIGTVKEDPMRFNSEDASDAIDQLLSTLEPGDQQALLLRFYGQRSLAEVGAEMRVSEEAARKRISRALKKLRRAAAGGGLSLTPMAIEQWLEVSAADSVPAHIANAGGAAALAGASGSGPSFTIARGVNRMFLWSKLRVLAAIIAIVLLPGILCIYLLNGAGGQSESYTPAATRPAGAGADGDIIQSKNIIMAISPDKHRVWAYSIAARGDWSQPATPIPQGATVEAVISESVGAFRAGDQIYAFSGITGKWDSAELPDDVAGQPAVSGEIAAIRDGNQLFGFSAVTGKWDVAELPNDVTAEPAVSPSVAMLVSGTHCWVFGVQSGKWRSVDTSAKQ